MQHFKNKNVRVIVDEEIMPLKEYGSSRWAPNSWTAPCADACSLRTPVPCNLWTRLLPADACSDSSAVGCLSRAKWRRQLRHYQRN